MKKRVKNTFVRAICMVSVLALLIPILSSCTNTGDVIYYKDENGKTLGAINENMFSYHLSDNKTFYVYGMGLSADSAELWNMPAGENMTIADMAFDSIVRSGKEMVAASVLYNATKTPESESDIQIEKQVDSMISQLVASFGNKSSLDSYLSGFGIDSKNLAQYYKMYFEMATLQQSIEVTEEEKKEYFDKNYSIVKHILVNTSFKVKDDGSMVALSEQEIAEKKQLADKINVLLSAGESFEELWEIYKDSDAAGAAKYPEGYFVSESSNFTQSFRDAALDMKENEIRTVNSEYGIHIIKKYPMDKEKYNLYQDVSEELKISISSEKFNALVAPLMEKVQVNTELLEKYSIINAPIMN